MVPETFKVLAAAGVTNAFNSAAGMAEGVRRVIGADVGLAVTGVAGPDGGTAEKPVGLVYTACAGPRGTTVARGNFPGDRAAVRDYSVTSALHLLLGCVKA